MPFPFHMDDVNKIEIRKVPKGVSVIVKEKGTGSAVEIRSLSSFGGAREGDWSSSTNYPKKTLTVWANMADNAEGRVQVNVPTGYKSRTTVHHR